MSSSSSSILLEQNQTAATDYHNNNNVSLSSETTNNNNVEEVHDHQNIQNPEQVAQQRRQQRSHRHNDDDDVSSSASSSSSDKSNIKKAQNTIKEMIYCFESFSMIFTPVSICMVLSALAVVFINTDETRQQTQQQFANTYEVITIDSTNSNTKNTLSSIGNALIIVSVVCVMTFVVALLYKYRCMKIFYGYMILVTTVLLGFLSSNMWIIAIEKYNWYRIDKFSFAFLIWNFTIVGILSIFWAPSIGGIPKFVQQGYLIVSSIILAWQLSFFSDWTAWTLLVILALYDLFAVLSPCGPLKYLAKLMSKQNAPEIPGLLYEATLPNGIKKPKSKPKRNNNNNDDNDNNNETKEQEDDDNNNNNNNPSSSSSSAPSSSSIQQQQPNSSSGGNKKGKSNSKPVGEERLSSSSTTTLKTLPGSSQFIVVNNNNDQSSSSSSRILIRSSSSSRSGGGGENVVVEVSQQQDHDEDDERQHEQQQQQQDHHPPPFFVSSDSSNNNTGGNKDVEEDSSIITSRIPLSQLPLSTAPAAASAAASANNEVRVVEEQTPLPLNTGRIPLAIAKLYKLRVVDEEGALQPKQNNKLLTWSRITRKKRNNDDNDNNNHNNWQTHYTPDEINEIEWTPKQLRTVITGIFPQYGGRVEKSNDEEDQNKEDNEDGGPRYNVYNRNGDLLRKFVVNKEGQVMQVVKKERSNDDDDDDDSNNSIKLGLGDFIFYSVLVSKAALHSFTAFSACMVVILFGLLATLVLLAMYGKALPALPISIFLGVITFLITRSLTEPWIQDVLRTPFYV